MANIIEVMKSIPDYIGSNGRSEGEIAAAEKSLGTMFAPDYRLYLKEIGLACFDGHELTGITNDTRLSVVAVTEQERAAKPNMPSSWYVVEQTGFDGIVIGQAPTGEIYQTVSIAPGCELYNSLVGYVTAK